MENCCQWLSEADQVIHEAEMGMSYPSQIRQAACDRKKLIRNAVSLESQVEAGITSYKQTIESLEKNLNALNSEISKMDSHIEREKCNGLQQRLLDLEKRQSVESKAMRLKTTASHKLAETDRLMSDIETTRTKLRVLKRSCKVKFETECSGLLEANGKTMRFHFPEGKNKFAMANQIWQWIQPKADEHDK